MTVGNGRTWFFEDVCTSHFRLSKGSKLYARQFNCEPEPPQEARQCSFATINIFTSGHNLSVPLDGREQPLEKIEGYLRMIPMNAAG